jgi:hypothetical protein
MTYNFPDEETLARYLCLLSKVLILARQNAHQNDAKMAQLLDLIHNVPDLLARWEDIKEDWILSDLEQYETKYCDGNHPFSDILKIGVEPNWQLKWKEQKEEN